ncbi:PIG-L deacetylase family protein [Nitrosomonas nitrosa]|uniref:PIG-L deacetylase family protein n=1 Tax=Nitrosomonas nitrosa TaxID=52442 RepID=UPI0015E6C0AF|nr:PIG-L family deacetylase [Nitrosomonas nitrosa]MCO6433212.1 PIG-L family deacetylase [Nitrosomonas nitrosa]
MKRFIEKLQITKINQLRLCPLPIPLIPIEDGRILVFAPHADDEVLGCGGTLALLQKKKCAIKVVFITNSAGAGSLSEDAPLVRRQEAKEALSVLGIDDINFLDEPDGSFRNSAHIQNEIYSLLQQFNPDWIFLPSVLDYHRDHVAISHTILSCWQSWTGAGRAFFYEIWCPLPATLVVDVSSVIDLKKLAISKYILPLSHCDYFSASIGLAKYRGLYLLKQQKPSYAEAFVEAEKKDSWKSLQQTMLNLRFYLESFLRN